MRRNILLFVLMAFQIGVLAAQDTAQEMLNPISTVPGGIRLQNVSGFVTYYSGSAFGVPGQNQAGTGGSATLGYGRFRDRTTISITYTPTYTTDTKSFGSKAISQLLSFNWRRNLTPQWTFSLASSGVITSQTEAIFTQTALANIARTPGTFDELSAAMVAGRLTNNSPLTAALTSAPVVESPSGILLYGSRFLTSTAQSTISYSSSSRLMFHVTLEANRSQALGDSSTGGTQPVYQLARTTEGSGSIGVSYSLSPRTQLSGSWASGRIFSNLQDGYTHSASVLLAHTMSASWFMQVHAGVGVIVGIRERFALPQGPQYQVGSGIGYRSHAHTFLASVDRSVGDTYGFGAGESISASGAWNWSLPGSPWSARANFSQQWLTGTGFTSFNSWRASVGLQRRLDRHMSWSMEYAYLSDLPLLSGSPPTGGQHMIRMSVSWSRDER